MTETGLAAAVERFATATQGWDYESLISEIAYGTKDIQTELEQR